MIILNYYTLLILEKVKKSHKTITSRISGQSAGEIIDNCELKLIV